MIKDVAYEPQKKVFFHGLNELRALAAIAVIFHHIEFYKYRLNTNSVYDLGHYFKLFISTLGKNGVLLFFVLSGFLITYLLLEEKQRAGHISIRKFYWRRVLRIWPLYVVVLLIGFLILPSLFDAFPEFFKGQSFYNLRIEELEYGNNFLLHLFFMSNIALIIFGPVAGAAHSWSVSAEEQFYIIWPWIIKYCIKYLLWVFLLIIFGASFCKFMFPNSIISNLFNLSYIDFMATGALFAYLFRNYKHKLTNLLEHKIVVGLILLSLVLHLVFRLPGIGKAMTFGALITMCIYYKFNFKPLDYIGKLSYGMYMYHPAIMYLSFSGINHLQLDNLYLYNIAIYGLTFTLSLLVSYLSYHYFELFFLKMKSKFSTVRSGNN